jgi:hypothetical protein
MTSILYKELYESAYSLGRKHRHITAIIYKNICVFGVNNLQSGRCGHYHNYSVHSEIACLNAFLKQAIKSNGSKKIHININNAWRYKLPKITIINVRVNQNGYLAESKPCDSCVSILKKYKVKEFHYYNGQEIIKEKWNTTC